MRLNAKSVDGKGSLDYLFQKIKENKDVAPVFAYSTLAHPHTPYYPPKEFLDRIFKGQKIDKTSYDIQFNLHAYVNGDFGEAEVAMESVRKCYKANLLYADHLVGDFIKRLKRDGLLNNTLLIIMADHGELLGEHGELNHGGTVWEELLSIPAILHYPEKIESASKLSNLTSGLDILPTILDLIGELENLKTDLSLDGSSIFTKDMDWKNRFLVVDSPPIVLPERLKAFPNLLFRGNIISRAVRTKNYKYIWQSNGEIYLFRTGELEFPESCNLHQSEDIANELHQKMIEYYRNFDSNFKLDEYPIVMRKNIANLVGNPTIRKELRKLGYLPVSSQ